MALAETILRKVHKYDLINKAIRLLPVISFVLAISSVFYLSYLPIKGNYRNTYISENALMPSQVISYFRESEWNIVRGYALEIENLVDKPIPERNELVESYLKDFGLATLYHENVKFNSTLYGVFHTPRADQEALLLAVPWKTSDGLFNEGAIAISLALMRYFTRLTIWLKNIIIVFPENAHIPLRSFVSAYHNSLPNHAGSIDAAIVIEYAQNGDYFDYIEMEYNGLNGQLPNLDLLNTANTIARNENVRVSIQGVTKENLPRNDYWSRLSVLFKGIVSLALTGLDRNSSGCEAFSGWQIQAFTIRAKGSTGPNDITQIGRIVDSTFRSVNNLLEKFHQSFFFYLLMNTDNFVSIGTYLPSAILVAISFALGSFGCIISTNIELPDFVSNLTNLLTIFTLIETFSIFLSVFLPWITIKSDNENITVLVILYSLTIGSFILSISPLFKFPTFKLSKPVTFSLMALSLFSIALLITALLIVHFSLAILVGLLSIPLTLIQPIITRAGKDKVLELVKDKKNEKTTVSKTPLIQAVESIKPNLKIFLCLFVSNPFIQIFIIGNFLYGDEGPLILTRGLLTSWEELQCWTWFVVILGWFPAWLGVSLSVYFGDFEPDYKKVLEEIKKKDL